MDAMWILHTKQAQHRHQHTNNNKINRIFAHWIVNAGILSEIFTKYVYFWNTEFRNSDAWNRQFFVMIFFLTISFSFADTHTNGLHLQIERCSKPVHRLNSWNFYDICFLLSTKYQYFTAPINFLSRYL